MTTSHAPNRSFTVLVTGASGFIGTALIAHLRERGHTVLRAVRHEPSGASERFWDPASGTLPAGFLDDVDAVIHLAGAPIAKRWTTSHRSSIRSSRVASTALLANAIAALPKKPVFLSGSAVGFYGFQTGPEVLDEDAPLGTGFLADVCKAWEEATLPASDSGARVVLLRTGLVLHPSGGVLRKLLLPLRFFVGGPLGSGLQWQPWISLTDEVRAIEHLLHSSVSGPVNLVAPSPVSNRELVRALGRAMKRPTRFSVPSFVLRVLLGHEMASETVLASQRLAPTRLLADGFVFSHPDIPVALSSVIE